MLSSKDGISWVERSSGTSKTLNAAAYGNNTYVVVGELGTIITSPDGTTWTDFNEPIPFVRPELQSERLSKCYTCDSLDRVNMLCLKCHCMVLAKSKFHDANCPINKW